MKRYLIPPGAFVLGAGLIAAIYFAILTWGQGWDSAVSQLAYNRWYIVPILIGFGVQAALYSILRFRLFIPAAAPTGAMAPLVGVMGASGGTSATAMVACCLHHATDVLPILGLSAAATFLTRYQRPFLLAGLGMNVAGILAMLRVLQRERRRVRPAPGFKPVVETK